MSKTLLHAQQLWRASIPEGLAAVPLAPHQVFSLIQHAPAGAASSGVRTTSLAAPSGGGAAFYRRLGAWVHQAASRASSAVVGSNGARAPTHRPSFHQHCTATAPAVSAPTSSLTALTQSIVDAMPSVSDALAAIAAAVRSSNLWRLIVRAAKFTFSIDGAVAIGAVASAAVVGGGVAYYFLYKPNAVAARARAAAAAAFGAPAVSGASAAVGEARREVLFDPVVGEAGEGFAVFDGDEHRVHAGDVRAVATPPPAAVAATAPAPAATTVDFEPLPRDVAPDARVCPITHEPMVDPVITSDGHTYERAAIQRWFDDGNASSPMTGLALPTTALIPNIAMRPPCPPGAAASTI